MTSDVAREAITGSGYYNGSAIAYMPNRIVTHKIAPIINRIQTVEELESLYTDRFDDVRYYTGDSASGV